ncbi:MAG: 50S ribosomal protein L28 [Thiotrichales bacterium]|nr:MAG: 50S ribosomal protein L28 [Thiotrichales bacterium]
MSIICQVSGKRPMAGNNVSHANNRNKRRFLPNLHLKRVWSEGSQKWVKLRICGKVLRLIDRIGLDAVLAKYGKSEIVG